MSKDSNSYKNINIYYHKNCSDGFGAAWSAWKKYGDMARYIPLSHNDEIVGYQGRDNYFLDFSPKEKYLEELESKSNKLFVIDHHVSAYDYLKDKDYYYYNVDKSGCGLSWDFFCSNLYNGRVPNIVKYIEDRDLWRFSLLESKKITLYIDSFDMTFESWNSCEKILDSKEGLDTAIAFGSAAFKFRDLSVDKIRGNFHDMNIGGYIVPAINCPMYQSYILSTIYEGYPFAASYYFNGDRYIFSLRSANSGQDVSEIAKAFGGGGHKNASGFSVKSLKELSIKNLDDPR